MRTLFANFGVRFLDRLSPQALAKHMAPKMRPGWEGLLHLVGEPTSERRMVYRSLRFFPLHAVGIASGDLFIYITKRLLFVGRIKFNPGQAGES